MADNYDDQKSAVLEGMYKGVAGKIDDVKQALNKEIQYGTEQQANAYESMMDSLKEGFDAVIDELHYVAQQNSSIYEYEKRERISANECLMKAISDTRDGDATREAQSAMVDAIEGKIN